MQLKARMRQQPLLAGGLSPFGRKHINVIGTYSFSAPDLGPTGVRELCGPDADDEDD
ncbi:hypothetical protein [Streptomyces sp. NPDC048155]|uniref:hypothetical protein n=1 Tax=unclassified Streptomyces TaxID=2593676 RepID=UPI0033F23DDD